MENKVICHCMNVSYADIEKALHEHQIFTDVEFVVAPRENPVKTI